MAVANAAMLTAGLFDLYVAGRVGESTQAGVGIGAIVASVTVVFFTGALRAIAPAVAQNLGAQRYSACGQVLAHAIVLVTIASAVLWAAAVVIPSATGLASALTGNEVGPVLTIYVAIRLAGTPFLILFLCGNRFLVGTQRTVPIAVIGGIASALQMGFTYLLGLGHLGPVSGAPGIGLAFVLAWSIGAALQLMVCRTGSSRQRFSTTLWPRRIDLRLLRSLLSAGLPLGAAALFGSSSYFVLTAIAADLGPTAAAAYAVVAQVFLIPQRALEIMATSNGSLVAAYLGGCTPDLAQAQHRAVLTGSVAATGVVVAGILLFRDHIAAVLSANDRIAAHVSSALVVAVLALVPLAASIVIYASLIAGGDVNFPSAVEVTSNWLVLLPLALILTYGLQRGILGIWLAEGLTSVVVASVLLRRLRTGKWLRPTLVEHHA